jgi:protein-S-isoprenylcysteine O-methyltransferase Ste14
MLFDAHSAIVWTWEGLGLLWLIGFVFTKRTVQMQPIGGRLLDVAMTFAGFAAFGTHWFAYGWLELRFVPDTQSVDLAGFLLMFAGALFAAWARLMLGSNWSGRPSIKAEHELIVKGPYALARHPIYTGLLLAVAGSAIDVGRWRAVLGFLLVLTAFTLKIRKEEQFMMQTFPEAYPNYRKRVKALIPGVL